MPTRSNESKDDRGDYKNGRPNNNRNRWPNNRNNYGHLRQRGNKSQPRTQFRDEQINACAPQQIEETTLPQNNQKESNSRRQLPNNWRNEASGEDIIIQLKVVQDATTMRSTRTQEKYDQI